MRRRQFMRLLGVVATWPIAMIEAGTARAENGLRRVGVLFGGSRDNPQALSGLAAFKKTLADLDWAEGHNLIIDVRWGEADRDRMQALAQELVGLPPDVIFAQTTPTVATLKRETQSIPIAFAFVSDPVGSGFVASLARPGGNVTSFINIEASLGGKWAEILKEVSPEVRQAVILFNPDTAPYYAYYVEPFVAAARSLGIEPIVSPVRSSEEIEGVVGSLAAKANASLVVTPDVFTGEHIGLITLLAARNRIPAVYPYRFMVSAGGLISYGIEQEDLYRRAAAYVDRVLKGTKPADLPVQLPTKFEMVVNLKTAKALGLALPGTLLGRADEVIE
jgi:putative tryptophan/tyrosine transport system substrate-binding protein